MQDHRAVDGVLYTLPHWLPSRRCEQTLLGHTVLFHSTLTIIQSLVRGCGGSSLDEACVQVSQHSCSFPVLVAQLEVGGGSVLKGRSWPKHISVSQNKNFSEITGGEVGAKRGLIKCLLHETSLNLKPDWEGDDNPYCCRQ